MSDWIAAGVGLVAGAVLLALCAALVASTPFVATRALQVLARREWVPITYNLRSLARHKLTTLVTLVVLGMVVFVLTSVSMLALGIQHTLTSTASPLNVKVVRTSSLSERTSWLTPDQVKSLAVTPGVARDEGGAPLVSAEMVVLIWAARSGSSDPDDGANLTVRGVEPTAFKVHSRRGLQGRLFAPETNEIIIGKALSGRFAGAELGGTMHFADRDWPVVGVADFGGSAYDSEIWGDWGTLRPTFRGGYSTATVMLTEREALPTLLAAFAANPLHSELAAAPEADYWKAQSETYVGFVMLLGSIVGLIFSFAAVLGALNTMYAQVTSRTRELGTLRAIGFKPRSILVSVLFESTLLSLAGGALGVAAAALLGSVRFRLTTVQTLSEISFGFHLSPALAFVCLGLSALMGYAGGLLPALRAARMPIVQAVRAD